MPENSNEPWIVVQVATEDIEPGKEISFEHLTAAVNKSGLLSLDLAPDLVPTLDSHGNLMLEGQIVKTKEGGRIRLSLGVNLEVDKDVKCNLIDVGLGKNIDKDKLRESLLITKERMNERGKKVDRPEDIDWKVMPMPKKRGILDSINARFTERKTSVPEAIGNLRSQINSQVLEDINKNPLIKSKILFDDQGCLRFYAEGLPAKGSPKEGEDLNVILVAGEITDQSIRYRFKTRGGEPVQEAPLKARLAFIQRSVASVPPNTRAESIREILKRSEKIEVLELDSKEGGQEQDSIQARYEEELHQKLGFSVSIGLSRTKVGSLRFRNEPVHTSKGKEIYLSRLEVFAGLESYAFTDGNNYFNCDELKELLIKLERKEEASIKWKLSAEPAPSESLDLLKTLEDLNKELLEYYPSPTYLDSHSIERIPHFNKEGYLVDREGEKILGERGKEIKVAGARKEGGQIICTLQDGSDLSFKDIKILLDEIDEAKAKESSGEEVTSIATPIEHQYLLDKIAPYYSKGSIEFDEEKYLKFHSNYVYWKGGAIKLKGEPIFVSGVMRARFIDEAGNEIGEREVNSLLINLDEGYKKSKGEDGGRPLIRSYLEYFAKHPLGGSSYAVRASYGLENNHLIYKLYSNQGPEISLPIEELGEISLNAEFGESKQDVVEFEQLVTNSLANPKKEIKLSEVVKEFEKKHDLARKALQSGALDLICERLGLTKGDLSLKPIGRGWSRVQLEGLPLLFEIDDAGRIFVARGGSRGKELSRDRDLPWNNQELTLIWAAEMLEFLPWKPGELFLGEDNYLYCSNEELEINEPLLYLEDGQYYLVSIAEDGSLHKVDSNMVDMGKIRIGKEWPNQVETDSHRDLVKFQEKFRDRDYEFGKDGFAKEQKGYGAPKPDNLAFEDNRGKWLFRRDGDGKIFAELEGEKGAGVSIQEWEPVLKLNKEAGVGPTEKKNFEESKMERQESGYGSGQEELGAQQTQVPEVGSIKEMGPTKSPRELAMDGQESSVDTGLEYDSEQEESEVKKKVEGEMMGPTKDKESKVTELKIEDEEPAVEDLKDENEQEELGANRPNRAPTKEQSATLEELKSHFGVKDLTIRLSSSGSGHGLLQQGGGNVVYFLDGVKESYPIEINKEGEAILSSFEGVRKPLNLMSRSDDTTKSPGRIILPKVAQALTRVQEKLNKGPLSLYLGRVQLEKNLREGDEPRVAFYFDKGKPKMLHINNDGEIKGHLYNPNSNSNADIFDKSPEDIDLDQFSFDKIKIYPIGIMRGLCRFYELDYKFKDKDLIVGPNNLVQEKDGGEYKDLIYHNQKYQITEKGSIQVPNQRELEFLEGRSNSNNLRGPQGDESLHTVSLDNDHNSRDPQGGEGDLDITLSEEVLQRRLIRHNSKYIKEEEVSFSDILFYLNRGRNSQWVIREVRNGSLEGVSYLLDLAKAPEAQEKIYIYQGGPPCRRAQDDAIVHISIDDIDPVKVEDRVYNWVGPDSVERELNRLDPEAQKRRIKYKIDTNFGDSDHPISIINLGVPGQGYRVEEGGKWVKDGANHILYDKMRGGLIVERGRSMEDIPMGHMAGGGNGITHKDVSIKDAVAISIKNRGSSVTGRMQDAFQQGVSKFKGVASKTAGKIKSIPATLSRKLSSQDREREVPAPTFYDQDMRGVTFSEGMGGETSTDDDNSLIENLTAEERRMLGMKEAPGEPVVFQNEEEINNSGVKKIPSPKKLFNDLKGVASKTAGKIKSIPAKIDSASKSVKEALSTRIRGFHRFANILKKYPLLSGDIWGMREEEDSHPYSNGQDKASRSLVLEKIDPTNTDNIQKVQMMLGDPGYHETMLKITKVEQKKIEFYLEGIDEPQECSIRGFIAAVDCADIATKLNSSGYYGYEGLNSWGFNLLPDGRYQLARNREVVGIVRPKDPNNPGQSDVDDQVFYDPNTRGLICGKERLTTEQVLNYFDPERVLVPLENESANIALKNRSTSRWTLEPEKNGLRQLKRGKEGVFFIKDNKEQMVFYSIKEKGLVCGELGKSLASVSVLKDEEVLFIPNRIKIQETLEELRYVSIIAKGVQEEWTLVPLENGLLQLMRGGKKARFVQHKQEQSVFYSLKEKSWVYRQAGKPLASIHLLDDINHVFTPKVMKAASESNLKALDSNLKELLNTLNKYPPVAGDTWELKQGETGVNLECRGEGSEVQEGEGAYYKSGANNIHYDVRNKEIVFDTKVDGGRETTLHMSPEELLSRIYSAMVSPLGALKDNPISKGIGEEWKLSAPDKNGLCHLMRGTEKKFQYAYYSDTSTGQHFLPVFYNIKKQEFFYEGVEGSVTLDIGDVNIINSLAESKKLEPGVPNADRKDFDKLLSLLNKGSANKKWLIKNSSEEGWALQVERQGGDKDLLPIHMYLTPKAPKDDLGVQMKAGNRKLFDAPQKMSYNAEKNEITFTAETRVLRTQHAEEFSLSLEEFAQAIYSADIYKILQELTKLSRELAPDIGKSAQKPEEWTLAPAKDGLCQLMRGGREAKFYDKGKEFPVFYNIKEGKLFYKEPTKLLSKQVPKEITAVNVKKFPNEITAVNVEKLLVIDAPEITEKLKAHSEGRGVPADWWVMGPAEDGFYKLMRSEQGLNKQAKFYDKGKEFPVFYNAKEKSLCYREREPGVIMAALTDGKMHKIEGIKKLFLPIKIQGQDLSEGEKDALYELNTYYPNQGEWVVVIDRDNQRVLMEQGKGGQLSVAQFESDKICSFSYDNNSDKITFTRLVDGKPLGFEELEMDKFSEKLDVPSSIEKKALKALNNYSANHGRSEKWFMERGDDNARVLMKREKGEQPTVVQFKSGKIHSLNYDDKSDKVTFGYSISSKAVKSEELKIGKFVREISNSQAASTTTNEAEPSITNAVAPPDEVSMHDEDEGPSTKGFQADKKSLGGRIMDSFKNLGEGGRH